MRKLFANIYDINERLPEIYDQLETESYDLEFLLKLLKNMDSPHNGLTEKDVYGRQKEG